MIVAVAICTFNRSDLLQKTLERICEIDHPVHYDWVLLIINNRSTDNTPEVISRFSRRLPIQSFYEEEQGLSNARNRALVEAGKLDADFIVWTDDDVLPCQDWLTAYEREFAKSGKVGIFGGAIDPLFETEPPAWFSQHFEIVKSAFGVIDPVGRGDKVGSTDMDVAGLPYGANFALRLNKSAPPRFDPRLGVKGNYRIHGEETALMEDLKRQGASGQWVPQARTQHFVAASKLNLSYIGMYYRGVGRTDAVLADECGNYWKKKWILRKSLMNFLRATKSMLRERGISANFLRFYVQANVAWGRFFT